MALKPKTKYETNQQTILKRILWQMQEIPLITGQTPKATALKTKPLGQYTLPGIMIHARIDVADPELFT